MPLTKIRKVFTTTSVIIFLLLALLLVGCRLFGIHTFTLLSHSMEPSLPAGSLVYVKEADPSSLKNGDIILFLTEDETVGIQRIVNVITDEEDTSSLLFQTRGDSNDTYEGTFVPCENIVGAFVFTIPLLGYVVNYIHNPPGLYFAICFSAVVLLLLFSPSGNAEDKTGEAAGIFKQSHAADQKNDRKKSGKYAGKYTKH